MYSDQRGVYPESTIHDKRDNLLKIAEQEDSLFDSQAQRKTNATYESINGS